MQFIFLIFVVVTNIVGFFVYLLSVPPEEEGKMLFIGFCMWCIYTVVSTGIYFYLGTLYL